MSQLRIAAIGLGDIAQKAYLPLLASHPQIKPLLCTRNTEVLQSLARQHRIEECYPSLEQLLEAKPDAVMVHSATQAHFSTAKRFLEAGIATFVDKPLSYSLAESRELIELAKNFDTPLMLGFNRRFAPLLAQLFEKQPVQVRWQKNRVNLPDDPRIFIFDDFIHVLDGLCQFAQPDLNQLQVFSRCNQAGQLEAIEVSWPTEGGWVSGVMNRISGLTEERLEVYGDNEKWQIDRLTEGHHWSSEGQVEELGFSDWHSHLHKRGFEQMLDAWLAQIRSGQADQQHLNSVLTSHQLAEKVLERVK